ncbi:hypothetical protein Afer_1483 [Acidimicrobium ferrooxidans DSM 10331]|uniref:Uncharacterized protein n=1 Tax=Acidimicrobium ferrooxidans (strain DSM 10331 / JCM 15462 / NBRC 103882 / ICP) TaxID=525909 RepID=C7M098_ACIFD|nr:hypothetical protein [Acidimicrobium ferrooxidans]ACU54406.1 hypothetical protein Afer_1483 [Acidimicrobium ferrooxidans DSM 10331]
MRTAVVATSTDLPTGVLATMLADSVPGRRLLIEIAGMESTWAIRDREHAPQPPGQRAIAAAISEHASSLSAGIVLAATVDLASGVVLDSLERWEEARSLPTLLADPMAGILTRSHLATVLTAMADWLAGQDRRVHSVVDAGYIFDETSAPLKWLSSCERLVLVTAPTPSDLGRLTQLVRDGLTPSAIVLLADRALGFVDAVRASLGASQIPLLVTPPLSGDVLIPDIQSLVFDSRDRRRRRRHGALEQLLVTARLLETELTESTEVRP